MVDVIGSIFTSIGGPFALVTAVMSSLNSVRLSTSIAMYIGESSLYSISLNACRRRVARVFVDTDSMAPVPGTVRSSLATTSVPSGQAGLMYGDTKTS